MSCRCSIEPVKHTPKSQEIWKRYDAFPTNMDGLMLLIKPGRVGVMENRRETAALQFYEKR